MECGVHLGSITKRKRAPQLRTLPVHSVILATIAVLALAGLLRPLPPYLAFFVSALAIILFPGMAIMELLGGSYLTQRSVAQRLVLAFALGTGVVTALALLGLILHLKLDNLTQVLIAAYVILAAGVITKRRLRPERDRLPGSQADERMQLKFELVLLAIAIGAALLTLLTPRDSDDWFYLAYINDYVAGKPLGAEDAIWNMGHPAPPRIWVGGAWWVLEALLSRASGIDPVPCHQVYMPILTVPFAVLAIFSLAATVFRSYSVGLLGCCLQILFYLSGAFPEKSAGWFLFCRTAQDKTVSCFVMVPVAAAIAVRLIYRRVYDKADLDPGLYTVYWLAVSTCFLVHGLGPVWCGLLIVPFAVGELLSHRNSRSMRSLVMVVLPIAACGLVLVFTRRLMGQLLQAPGLDAIPVSDAVAIPYLPGSGFGRLTETLNPIVWVIREGLIILNPLFVTRLPLAIGSAILTPWLIPRWRREPAAHFLLAGTLAVAFLAFTPIGAGAAASLITTRMLFRLAWVLPWGLTLAFFISCLRLRPVAKWLLVVAIALALARGNPYNYVSPLERVCSRNRPVREATEVLAFLTTEPSPQGKVFAPDAVSRMIPAYLPNAVPVGFRDWGVLSRERMHALVREWKLRNVFFEEVTKNDVRYVIVENDVYMARVLAQNHTEFELRYNNAIYSIYKALAPADTVP
jgi:hypothetical protein